MNDEIYVYIGRILLGTYAAQIKNVKCIRALKVHWCRFENFLLCFYSCKNNSEKFAFLTQRIVELFSRKVCEMVF